MSEQERGRLNHERLGAVLAVLGLLLMAGVVAINTHLSTSFFKPALPWYVVFGSIAVAWFFIGSGYYISRWGGNTIREVIMDE